MKKVEGYIYHANIYDIKNDRTGEINKFTKIEYLVEESDTEYSIGYFKKEFHKKGNLLKFLKEYTMKKCIFEIEEIPTINGTKYKLLKINNVEV